MEAKHQLQFTFILSLKRQYNLLVFNHFAANTALFNIFLFVTARFAAGSIVNTIQQIIPFCFYMNSK